jgi:N4-(beta-N-acetylglucosaminyl)-L-asparaginase
MSVEDSMTRRCFLAAAAAGAGASLPALALPAAAAPGEGQAAGSGKEAAISSGNGLRATARAIELVRGGADTLDAAVAGVNIVEEDPEDMTVGHGGLPNEEGVVQLDACVMHGPSWSCGAVAALEKIKTPASVARLVMTRTDHILLVGEGALRFALAHGFEPVNLLTEKARKAWLEWKERRSDTDDWLTPAEGEKKLRPRPTGTITCLVRNARGELSGVTSTSGLAFKLPGRVGDSPIIGAGLYVDNDVGAAGATGRGEAVITQGGSRIVVENMRHGMSPAQAVRDVLERIARQTVDPRLRDKEGRPAFNVTLYALSKAGELASGSLWSGSKFAAHDGTDNTLRDGFHLFARSGKEDW